ncbi:LOW QUALITY PROTEIN: disintegrin and metalloproteinase domain-containing protein 15 [Pelodiscus sinensis]|uniref:LOW QUALITY PROTEIN: disintegrin and metalloproteinase domain-containing protein 15 n=1 Tax=Pelodiscus sinensis TaxID=13735 RepID=UPI003F6C9DDF
MRRQGGGGPAGSGAASRAEAGRSPQRGAPHARSQGRRLSPAMGLRLLLGLLWALGGSGSGLPGSPQERGAAWGARRAGGSCRRLREALGSSWHVTPRILEGNRTRSAAEAALGGFPARLQVALELEGEQLVLELEQNREGAPGTPALVYYLPNGTRVTQAAGPQGSCCYRGHIWGYPGSWASICTCAGLSGLLVASENRSYGLEPDPQGPPGRHRAYRPRAVPPGPSSPTRPEPRRGKRDVAPEQPFVELVMVVDYAEFRRYPHLERIRTRVLEIINQVDTFYQPLGLRVALLAVEVWNQGDPFAVGPSARATLERFLTWRQKDLLPRLPHDNAQLLTGLRLEGAEVGMATQASMCSAARSGGVSMDHSVSVLVVASSVAHQLGHNLGMGHDGPERQCGCVGLYQERSCIMAPPTELMPGLSFSNCSRQDVARSLRRDWAWCLFNVPEPESLAGRPHCGNRLLERGEACDCGFPEECTDPCCDAGTCRLVPGAECAAGDACCQHCKLRQAGSVCRQARGECDLPEFCDGLSPRCPPNVHLQDGQPCAGGQAYCYGGTCPTYQGQCQELWGPDSGPVSDACLAALNARGDAQGHCGQHPNGSYAPCAQRDSACGRLQCQGGGAQGALEDGGAPGCRRTPPPPSEDVSDLAVAMPGTACGSGKACRGGQCRDVSELGGQACGTKCHGHGVCNNKGHCHCEEGWAPPTCASRGLGGSEDSGPVRALEQGGSALLPVTLLLLAVLLALGVWGCYAKRGGLPCRLCRLGKGTGCQYRISQTEPRGSDRPQPGPPRPPRPQSTELQMMPTSKPAPHGSARPDPPSKPLPPDPVPRGSQAVLWGRPPPPTRPLPADPVLTGAQPPGPARPPLRSDSTGPLLSGAEVSAVPSYGPQAMLLPSRPAPPPPAGHLQDT